MNRDYSVTYDELLEDVRGLIAAGVDDCLSSESIVGNIELALELYHKRSRGDAPCTLEPASEEEVAIAIYNASTERVNRKVNWYDAEPWIKEQSRNFAKAAMATIGAIPVQQSAATTETYRHQSECERYGRGGGVRRAFFIIVEPGKVPVGKGPFITFDQVEKFARDAIEHHPQPDTHIIRCELTWNDELWVQCAREQAEIDAALDGVDWDEVDAELARNDGNTGGPRS